MRGWLCSSFGTAAAVAPSSTRVTRDDVAEPPDEPGAPEPGELSPRSRQRLARRRDSEIDITGVAVRGGGPGGPEERVNGVVTVAGSRLDPTAIDDQLIARGTRFSAACAGFGHDSYIL
jgi:hypothetical protein